MNRSYAFLTISVMSILTACSSSDNKDPGNSSSGTNNNGSSNQGTNNNGSSSGGCSGDFESCKMGTLSDVQLEELCTTALKVSGAQPGTEKTCDGGQTVTLEDADTCTKNFKSSIQCKAFADTSVGTNLDCLVASFKDPCALLNSNNSACTTILSALQSCQ